MLSDRPLTNEELQDALVKCILALDAACHTIALCSNLPKDRVWNYQLLLGAGASYMLTQGDRAYVVASEIARMNDLLSGSVDFALLKAQVDAGKEPEDFNFEKIMGLADVPAGEEGATDA